MTPYVWTLRVTSPDRATARVASRTRQFVVSRPIEFDVEHEGTTALEYVFGALGAEIVTGFCEFARRRRIDVEDIEAVVAGELNNPLTYLEVVGENGHPGILRILVKVYVTSSAREALVRQVFEKALDLLPLVRTFRSLVQLEVNVTHVP